MEDYLEKLIYKNENIKLIQKPPVKVEHVEEQKVSSLVQDSVEESPPKQSLPVNSVMKSPKPERALEPS